MDLATFVRVERVTGSLSPVDTNPTEPTRPGSLHYLATLYRDGRTFATHLSAPVGEPVDIGGALRAAAARARRLEGCATREQWLDASGIRDQQRDPLQVGAAHAGEADLWYRAQRADAQALRTFLGEVAYRALMELARPTARPDGEAHSDEMFASAARRRRWWIGAAVSALAVAVPVLAARANARRRSSSFRTASFRTTVRRLVAAR